MVSDRTQEQSRVTVTTTKIERVYSPASDSARKKGRKAAAVVSEAVRSGMRSSWAACIAASSRFFPSAILTMIDSDITIALSTSMPSAMISAASDIWSRLTPKNGSSSKEAKMAMGINVDTTSPVRTPSVTSITRTTTPIAWSRLLTTLLIFCSTTSGWNATMSNSMPIGNVAVRRR